MNARDSGAPEHGAIRRGHGRSAQGPRFGPRLERSAVFLRRRRRKQSIATVVATVGTGERWALAGGAMEFPHFGSVLRNSPNHGSLWRPHIHPVRATCRLGGSLPESRAASNLALAASLWPK